MYTYAYTYAYTYSLVRGHFFLKTYCEMYFIRVLLVLERKPGGGNPRVYKGEKMSDINSLEREHSTPAPAPQRVFYSQRELALRWSISKPGVRNLIKSGSLDAVRLGGRVLIPATAVENFENNLQKVIK